MSRRLFSLLLSTALTFALPLSGSAATKKPSVKKKNDTTFFEKKPAPIQAYPAEPEGGELPILEAGAALLVDAATGQILYSYNPDDPRPVASTQKLLTALVIAEEGDLNRRATVQVSDTKAEPTKLYLKPGETYRRYDLLNILLVKSMNDVALCLARDNAGSIAAFADKMNAKAQQLGMRNSHFVNPNGLPAPGQYSTARDMARVALAVYRNSTLRKMISDRDITWRYNDGRVRTFTTTNKVLQRWPLCNGMKTGYTNAAGHCLISSATYGGRHMISLIFNDKQVWDDSYKMLAWGLAGSGAN